MTLSLFSLILGQNHLNKILFWAFIDSISTYYFLNLKFVNTHYLKISATLPVALHLFDGSSNNIISEIANLPIIFPASSCINLDFYVTLLNSSYSLVLRCNWLTQHNSLINWVNRLIKFCLSLQENLASFYIMANTLLVFLLSFSISLQLLDSAVSIPVSKTAVFTSE